MLFAIELRKQIYWSLAWWIFAIRLLELWGSLCCYLEAWYLLSFASVSIGNRLMYWFSRRMTLWGSISFNLAVFINIIIAFFYPYVEASSMGKYSLLLDFFLNLYPCHSEIPLQRPWTLVSSYTNCNVVFLLTTIMHLPLNFAGIQFFRSSLSAKLTRHWLGCFLVRAAVPFRWYADF